jgi:hypothetical protein
MAWSKRAQSELIREERSRTVRENGVRKNDEDSHWTPTIPIFGQLGNLRERREKRRSGKHSRLCGEIVLAHVFDDGARGPVAPRKRKPIRGETHDAARRRTHHDNMVKADWVKYPMDRSRQREASATFSFEGTYLRRRTRVLHTRSDVAASSTRPKLRALPFGRTFGCSGGRGDAVHQGRA